jgi:glycosyltransferase involved in cell wall biosynthesis
MVSVKRLDLIQRSIHRAARDRPDLRVEWLHIGDGPDRARLERESGDAPPNVRTRFYGQLSATAMMNVYRSTPIDVFVNLSWMEGTPVSLMEAASCSIPIVATAVGGNPDLVSAVNGTLLASDPSELEVAAALVAFADGSEEVLAKGRAARQVWATKYEAAANYKSFAAMLRSLRGGVALSGCRSAGAP